VEDNQPTSQPAKDDKFLVDYQRLTMQKHKNNITTSGPSALHQTIVLKKTGVLRWGWQQLKLTRCFTMRFDSNIMATPGMT
jgi:hypothetical protein